MNALHLHDGEDNGEGVFQDEHDMFVYNIPQLSEIDDSILIFTGHQGELYTAVCSPTDNTLVATGGGDSRGFLWRISPEPWSFELQGHNATVSSLAFSADGQLLASGSLDGIVQVWDIARGVLKCTLEGSLSTTEWVRWHPKGHLVLAGSEDPFIWMWDADSSACMHVFSGHESSVTCADFTPDGKTICTGSDDATMRIWNPETGESIHVVRDSQGNPYHKEGITCLTITSDSSLVLTGSNDGSVHIVSVSTGQVVTSLTLHSSSIECVVFEASSRQDCWRAATGSMDNELIIWDSERPWRRIICDHEEGVTCLLWPADSICIVSGCFDGKVRLWNSDFGYCVRIFSGHSAVIQSITASCYGNFLVSISADGTARAFMPGLIS